MKSTKSLAITFLILLIDTVAIGVFTAIIMHVLVIENMAGNISRTSEDVLFGTGFLIMLSPAFLLAAPILGYCSDSYGRKRVLAFNMMCDCVGYGLVLLGLLVNSIIFVFLGLALLGIGNSSLTLILTIVTDVTSGKSKLFNFAIIAIAMNTLGIATHFGNLLLGHFQNDFFCYKLLLPVLIFLELINLFLIIIFLPETNRKPKQKANFTIKQALKALSLLLSKKQTCFLLAILFIIEIASGLYYQYIFSYLTNVLNSTAREAISFVNFRIYITLLSLALLYPILIYYFSIKKLIFAFFVCASIGMIGATISPLIQAQWFFCVLIACSITMLEPILWSSLSNCASRFHQGLMLSLTGPAWVLAWMISGIITDNAHYTKLPLIISAGVLLIGVMLNYYKLIKQDYLSLCRSK